MLIAGTARAADNVQDLTSLSIEELEQYSESTSVSKHAEKFV